MKRNNSSFNIAFWIGVIIIVIIIYLNLRFEGKILNDRLFDFSWFAAETIFTTVVVGVVAKVISDDIVKVKSNDNKMRKLGIYEIGEGKLNTVQTNIMFGAPYLNHPYPQELRFMFVSGDSFFTEFKDRIIKAVEHGCVVKVLLANPDDRSGFLKRSEKLIPQDDDVHGNTYSEQVIYTTRIIDKISEVTNNYFNAKEIKEKRGSIEVRYYIDEWRYNIRIASYHRDKNSKEYHRVWLNYQSPLKDSINQCLTVIGYLDANNGETSEEETLVHAMQIGFDKIWDLYEKTGVK